MVRTLGRDSAARNVDERPGGFPEGAHDDAELFGLRGDRGPEQEGVAALAGGELGDALVLQAGVIDGGDPEARSAPGLSRPLKFPSYDSVSNNGSFG
jgi:hypothetical protein